MNTRQNTTLRIRKRVSISILLDRNHIVNQVGTSRFVLFPTRFVASTRVIDSGIVPFCYRLVADKAGLKDELYLSLCVLTNRFVVSRNRNGSGRTSLVLRHVGSPLVCVECDSQSVDHGESMRHTLPQVLSFDDKTSNT